MIRGARVSRSRAPDEGRLTPSDRQLEARRAWALGFRPTPTGWKPPPNEGWRKAADGRSWVKDVEPTDRSVR